MVIFKSYFVQWPVQSPDLKPIKHFRIDHKYLV